MDEASLQFLSDADGAVTGVLVPIGVWREISAEIETRHLLKSDAMRRRLLAAMARDGGTPLDEATRRLGLSDAEEPAP